MTKTMIDRASNSRFTLVASAALLLLGGTEFANAQEVVIAREMNERVEQHVAGRGWKNRLQSPRQVATDGSWNANASDVWSNSARWLGGSIADGVGATGNFLFDIGANRTITIDGAVASRTLGIMNIGDANNSNGYVIAASGVGTLTFDNTSNAANASISMVSTSANNLISAPVQLNNSLDLSNASANTLTISGTVSSIAAGGTQTITALSGNETISGAISNGVSGGTIAVAQSGSGTLALNGANTYSGSTTISSGKISINGTSTLGDGTGTLFLSGGTLVTSANRSVTTAPVANNIVLTADSAITTTSTAGTVSLNLSGAFSDTGGTLTFRNDSGAANAFAPRFSTGDFTMDRPMVLDNGVTVGATTELADFNTNTVLTTHTYSGVISGNGAFRRTATTNGTGGDTLFSAQNTFTGGVVLNDGTIDLGVSSVGAPGSLTSGPLGTGTLSVTGNATALSAFGGSQVVGNAITLNGNLSITGANNLELSGPVALAATRTIRVTGGGTTTVSGVISGAGGLTKNGGGSTLVLTNANTYTGVTTIGAGTLQLGNNGATGSLSTSSAIVDNNVFKINRNNAVVQGTDFSGAAITGTGSLVQAGFGTTTLNVANSYSGGTTISGTGLLTASAGHGSHVPSGGSVLIAAADGALGSGNVSLTSSGVRLTLQGGVTNNYISDNATLSMVTGATADLNFTGGTDIISGLVLGGVTQTDPGTYGSSDSGALHVFNDFFLDGGTLTLVPEPSTWVMTIMGASLLLSVQRFRRRKS